MMQRVLLVAWKGATATGWVQPLEAAGYTVLLEDTTGERAWRTAKERGIDCVIIDGQKKPSHGRATGNSLRDTAKTREIPIIWTNLDPEDEAGVRTDVHPDRTLAAPTEFDAALSVLSELAALRAPVELPAPAPTSAEPPPAITPVEDTSAPSADATEEPAESAPVTARPVATRKRAPRSEAARSAAPKTSSKTSPKSTPKTPGKATSGKKPAADKASTGKPSARKSVSKPPARKTPAKKPSTTRKATGKTADASGAKATGRKTTGAPKSASRKTSKPSGTGGKVAARKAPRPVSGRSTRK